MDTGRPQWGGQRGHLARMLQVRTLIPLVSITLIAAIIGWYFSPLDFLRNARAASLDTIAGQLPQLAKSSQVTGDADPNTTVTIAVGLHLRNESGLAQYVKNISQAKHKVTRTLTPDQLIRAYSPLPSDEQAIIDYMQSYGLQATKTFKTHTMIGFSGTVNANRPMTHFANLNVTHPCSLT